MCKVYESCPVFSKGQLSLRLVRQEDCSDLLKVYSDPQAQKLFNSDNCHGDDFCYVCEEQMQMAIEFWLLSYNRGDFVRWTVAHKDIPVGSLELFKRSSGDEFDGAGVLRLDLRSDFEEKEFIADVLSLILPQAKAMFGCDFIATKIHKEGKIRREAFEALGFVPSPHKLMGHDGTEYGDYYIYRLPCARINRFHQGAVMTMS